MWPVTNREDKSDIQESIEKFSVKSVTTVGQITRTETLNVREDNWVERLINRIGNLQKLIRTTAFVLRLLGRTPRQRLWMEKHNKNKKIGKEISASEYDDAWKFLIYWDQKTNLLKKNCVKLVPKEVNVIMSNLNISYPHSVLGGRVRNFPLSFTVQDKIPIIPHSSFAKKVILFYHNKYHKEVDTIVANVR